MRLVNFFAPWLGLAYNSGKYNHQRTLLHYANKIPAKLNGNPHG